jgi:hypothetical protein
LRRPHNLKGLKAVISADELLRVVGEADNGRATIDRVRQLDKNTRSKIPDMHVPFQFANRLEKADKADVGDQPSVM